jgi:predicted transcriptional regulator
LLWCLVKPDPVDLALRRAFGQAIQSLRRKHKPEKLSQEALAWKASDMNRGFLSALELGKHDPGLWTLWRLKTALGITFTRLVREIELHYKPPK